MIKTTLTYLLIFICCATYAQQDSRSFIFENNQWTPNAPFDAANPSTEIDNIIIKNGSAEFIAKTTAFNINIESSAELITKEAEVYISGNLVNNGIFDGKDSNLHLNGISPQIFSGNKISLGFLFLEDSSELNLETEVAVYKSLKLTNALLNTNELLTLKSTYDELTNTIKDAVVFSEENSLVNGEVIVEKFIPARRTQKFIASPVSTSESVFANWQENGAPTQGSGTLITGNGGSTNGFDESASNNSSAFVFNVQNQQYNAITNTNTRFLNAGEVFRLYISGDRSTSIDNSNDPSTITVLRSKGTLSFGDYNLGSVSEQKNGATLVGNPYQAYISVKKLLERAINVNQRFYHIWDPSMNKRGAFITIDMNATSNDYITNVTNNSSIMGGILSPGQAIFTNTLENGISEITFKESDKILETPLFSEDPTPIANIQNSISIYLYEDTEPTMPIDGTHISFSENETNSVNSNDGLKYYNVDETIASVVGNNKLSFQNRELPRHNDVVPLFITNYRGTQYKMKVVANDFSNENKPYLKDNFLNTLIPLENGEQEITFTVENANTSIYPNRFSIVFENLLSTNDNELTNNLISLAPNPTNEYVQINNDSSSEIENVKIYDTTGKLVKTIVAPKTNDRIIVSDLANSIYLLNITFENKSTSTKRLVKI